MTIRPSSVPFRLPRSGTGAVTRGADFDGAMQQLEQAEAGNVKQGTTPAFPGIVLTSPDDGSSWLVTVASNGQLRTEAVPR